MLGMNAKFSVWVAGALLLFFTVPSAMAGQAAKSGVGVKYVPTGVRIEYVHPERFTDFRLQGRSATWTAPIFSREIGAALEQVLARRLPGGSLTLRFNDIDLAGRYEPRRGPQFDNIRFVRTGATPIRLNFDYTLTDSQGRIVSSGTRGLSDTFYLDRYPNALIRSTFDQLFYEKQLLQSWLTNVVRSS